MSTLHIPPLAPEVIFHVGRFPVTNTMVNVWLAMGIFLGMGIILRRSLSLRPGKLQNFFEYILESVLGYFDQVTGNRRQTIRFLPISGSIFFFILLSNWLGLLPGVGSITFNHELLLRSANTDLNLTVAMALTSVIVSHLFGFFTVGVFTHLNKFIQLGTIAKSFRQGPIAIFSAVIEFGVGIIEIAGEFAKVLSLSLRLFGNIFAGEVLLTVMASLFSFLLPTPFMLLELLVGLIQAAVFAILSLVYMTVMSSAPHGAEEH
ncbi:MAG: F0F1 ATP synthase subunit A [Candidatus Magasanikbacteria bacterium]|nr:F0F1 ATP synthase subunit A [Candidatus Magasanikbacteria bacterium]